MTSQTTTTIHVDGMSCQHCSGAVQRALENINGISNVSVDLDGKSASFDASSPQLIDLAVQEVIEAGYKASK